MKRKTKAKNEMQLLVWELNDGFTDYFLGINKDLPGFNKLASGAIAAAEKGAMEHNHPICFWVLTCSGAVVGEMGSAQTVGAMAEIRDNLWKEYNLKALIMICSEPFWERISKIPAGCSICRAEADEGKPPNRKHLH